MILEIIIMLQILSNVGITGLDWMKYRNSVLIYYYRKYK